MPIAGEMKPFKSGLSSHRMVGALCVDIDLSQLDLVRAYGQPYAMHGHAHGVYPNYLLP